MKSAKREVHIKTCVYRVVYCAYKKMYKVLCIVCIDACYITLSMKGLIAVPRVKPDVRINSSVPWLEEPI